MAESKQDLIDGFLLTLRGRVLDWDDFAETFGMAFDRAYVSYKSTLDKQAKADAQRLQTMMQLLFIATSIVGGSSLIAVFGGTSVKAAVKEAGVRVICNNNMRRIFALAAIAEKSPIASFALGSLFDSSTSFISKQAKDRIVADMTKRSASGDGSQSTPLSTYLQIKNVITKANRAVNTALEELLRSNISLQETKLALAALSRAPIMSEAPSTHPKLSQAIELTMFLNLILSRDSLVTKMYTGRSGDGDPGWVYSGKSAIDTSVNSRNYPKAKSYMRDGKTYSQSVSIRDTGDLIDKRINSLHRALLGRDLLATGLFSSLSLAEMKKAEHSLNALATVFLTRAGTSA